MKKPAGTQSISPARAMTRRQLSRHQRELRQRRIIYSITAAVVGLIVLILAFGYYRENIGKGDETVARVGGTAISGRTMAKALGYYSSLYLSQLIEVQGIVAENQQAAEGDEAKKKLLEAANLRLQQLSGQLQSVDSVALDNLVNGELLRQDAARRGIALSQADRERALVSEMDLGIAQLQEGAAPLPATPSAEALAAAQAKLPRVLENGRILSEDEFNRLILEATALRLKVEDEATALRLKVEDETNAQVAATGEQVHAQHILVDSEEKAKDVLATLNKGELDFAATAKQMSLDTSNKDEGGDLGWFPRGVMGPDFEKVAFEMEAGKVSEPVQTQFGYHIIKVVEKASDRPLEADMLAALRAQAYQKYVNELQADDKSPVQYELDESKVRWISANAPQPTPPTPAPTAQP
ncbi:MAG: peptidylprolyl isomerase [Chloroflexota bacterium]